MCVQFAVEQLRGAASRVGQAGFLQEQATRAARHLAEATKDNDFIYHERVPDVRQLEPIARASVAKPLPMADHWAASHKGMSHTTHYSITRLTCARNAHKADGFLRLDRHTLTAQAICMKIKFTY